MDDDCQLLRRYARDGSEAAFRELVARHIDLVYSTARRKLGSEWAQAEDVTQAVFADLARKAGHLSPDGVLGGWLYQHTCFVAAATCRRERRRQHREQEAVAMNPHEDPSDGLSRDLAPVLDEVMARLDSVDRDAVVLRFFERRDLRGVGMALGLSPDAAQKRVARALDKLRVLLARRGITSTSAALGLILTANAVTAAPAALAASVAGPALAAATSATFTFATHTLTTMSKFKAACLGACLIAGVATPLVWQHQTIARQQEMISALEGRLAESRGRLPPPNLAHSGSRQPNQPAGGRASTGAAVADGSAAAGLARVLAEPDQIKRLGALSALLQAMAPDDAPAFGRLFRDRLAGGSEFSNEYQLFLRAWGGIDGAAAVTFSLEGDWANSEDARSALAGWGARDPLAASAWLAAHPQDGQTELLAGGLAEGWMQQDLDAAAKFIEGRPRSDARTGMLAQLFSRLIDTRGVEGAKSWFAAITDNENNTTYRARAFDQIAKYLARTDPDGALSWLVDHAGQAYAQSQAVGTVMAARAATDPAGAAEWAVAHPEIVGDGGPHTALATAIETWVKHDPNAAAAWLGQKMNTPAYDPAAQAFVSRAAALDPESAFAWARTIGDEGMRRQSQEAAARPWINAAPDAAKTALADAGWTPEQIDGVQNQKWTVALGRSFLSTTLDPAGVATGAGIILNDRRIDRELAIEARESAAMEMKLTGDIEREADLIEASKRTAALVRTTQPPKAVIRPQKPTP